MFASSLSHVTYRKLQMEMRLAPQGRYELAVRRRNITFLLVSQYYQAILMDFREKAVIAEGVLRT